MTVFKLKISHTTHSSFASNINITKNLYLDPPNIKFVLDYTDSYGDISEEGVRKLVEPNVTSIITGARIVMISNGIISEVTKSKYLEELSPQREITHEKIKQVLTNKGQITIPPPPTTPPPRLPYERRLIQHVKRNDDKRANIECRQGINCWRNKKGICSYKHPHKETEV